jgi:phospholipid/cholesterol/gamma-HCH transport system substrate-binding protein
VGAFAVVSLAIMVLIVVVFAGLRFWEGRDRYYVVFRESVIGLQVGSEVLINGIRSGKVDAIELDSADVRRVRVTLDLEEGTPVHADTRAILTFAGITGLKIIDLRGGSPATARVPTESVIPVGTTTLDQLQAQAQTLATQTAELMNRASALLDNMIAITEPSQFAGVNQIVARAGTATENLAAATAELRALVAENRQTVKRSLHSVDQAAQKAAELFDGEMERVLVSAGALIADLRGAVRTNQTQLVSTLTDLRKASESFKEMARELRQRPSRILFAPTPRDRALP